jgi:glucuronokinase
MPSGDSVVSSCSARAALAGNPSDLYGGAVVAVPLDDLVACASVEAGDRFEIRTADGELRRLIRATVDAFVGAVAPIGDVAVSATTTIPRSVGLAGSSALIISVLRALAGSVAHRFGAIELAELALAIERDRLGIEAGLQDRLVQAVGRPVAMSFDPVAFRILECPVDLPLFVAWSSTGSETSDTVHRSLRRRFDGDDGHVGASMAGLAAQARRAGTAIEAGDLDELGAAMNRTFEIRSMMIDIDPVTLALAERAAALGAAVNSAGSGGSIVGLARDGQHLAETEASYVASGHFFLAVS